VMRREHFDRPGSSFRRFLRRSATGLIIFFATDRNPA
jgi:hypothetical protein